MTDEDIQLLEAVRDYRPPTKIHPLADLAWALYQRHGDDLPPEVIATLREQLAKYEDIKELTDALCGMSAFMIYISEHLDDQENGEKVAEMMKEVAPRYTAITDRVREALENLNRKAKGVYDRFVAKDEAEEKRAPVFGSAAPEGSVPLKNLKPVAEPPPWARKKK